MGIENAIPPPYVVCGVRRHEEEDDEEAGGHPVARTVKFELKQDLTRWTPPALFIRYICVEVGSNLFS